MITPTISKRTLILFCLLAMFLSASSQHHTANWLFGEFGLEFQHDTILVRNDYAPHENRGAGIISDENGNLQLYTDGFTAWNSMHEEMPNGDSLTIKHAQHSIHESLLFPAPGSGSLIYIFTADPYNGQESSGLYYSIVDLSLEGGLGDVTVKGEKLLDTISNKITAVLHNNQRDLWLITHKFNTNSYYAFLLTDAGISSTPVESHAGPTIGSSFDGQLKASPDGKRVACSHEAIDGKQFVLFDFDDQTGVLSNSMEFPLPESNRSADGIEFSSDATKLLVYQAGSTGESGLYHFDLSSLVYEDILGSMTTLIHEQHNSFTQMQIAENGKIYLTKGGGGGGAGYLGVVHNPNETGVNCIVEENGLFLDGAGAVSARTPNFNQSYFFKTSFELSHTCQSSPINFLITNENKLDSVRWQFGEGNTSSELNPEFEYQLAGDYLVELRAYYPEKTDTIIKLITIHPTPVFELGNDTTACPNLEIGVDDNFISYLWNTGESYPTIKIEEEGRYILSVENNLACISSDTIQVSLFDPPIPILPDTIDLNSQDSVQLIAGVFQSYDWNTGDTTQSIYVAEKGWYSVSVENEFECQAARSVYVADRSEPGGPQERTGWEVLNPLPSVLAGLEICFVDDQNGFIVTENELLRTVDGGDSWEWYMELSSGRHLAFSSSIGYIVGAGGAIYKSTHNGEGWNKLQVAFNNDLNTVTVIHPDTVLATGNSNLFVTHDGGENWEIHPVQGVDIEASHFTSALVGHVACKEGTILKTIDGGLNWYTTLTTNHTPSDFFDISFITPQLGLASRAHSDLLRTTDGGESWEVVDDYLEAAYDIYFVNENLAYLAGNDGVIFKTTDSGISWDWSGFQGLIGGSDLYGIYFMNKYKGFAVGQRGRIIQTTDEGSNWEGYAPSYNHIDQVAYTSQDALYALGEKIFKSIDGGQNWDSLHTGVHNEDRYTYTYIEGQFFSDDEFYVIASGGELSKVLKSTDGGQSFERVKSNDNDIRATSIHFLNLQIGYVCNSYSSYWSGLHKTEDGGVTWVDISSHRFRDIWFINENVGFGLLGDELYQTNDGGSNWDQTVDVSETLRKITFANDMVGYITGDNGVVLKTTDQGVNWQQLSTGYDDNYAIEFYNQDIGFVTGEYKSFHSTIDGGLTWETQTLAAQVNSISVSDELEVFVAGTYGAIMQDRFEYDTVSVAVMELLAQKDGELILFPNPARDILNLVTSEVMETIHIYDIQGKILISKSFRSQLDISELESGLYFITVSNKIRTVPGRFLKE